MAKMAREVPSSFEPAVQANLFLPLTFSSKTQEVQVQG